MKSQEELAKEFNESPEVPHEKSQDELKAAFDAQKQPKEYSPRPLDAVKGAVAQGLSGDFSDELEGGFNAGLAMLGVKINDNNDLTKGFSLRSPAWNEKDITDAYTGARDARRLKLKREEKDYPVTTTATKVGAGMFLPLGAAGNAARGAKTVLQSAKAAAIPAFIQGALTRIGSDRGEKGELTLPSVGETLKTGALSAGLAGALGGAANSKAAGVASQKVGDFAKWLKEEAPIQAFKSILPPAGITNTLKKMGLSSSEEQRRLGRKLMDEKFLSPTGNKEATLEKVQEALGGSGERIGRTVDQADEIASELGTGLNSAKVMEAADTGLPVDNAVADLAAGKGKELIGALEKQAALTPSSFRGFWDAKRAAQKGLKFEGEAPLSQTIAKDVERNARQEIIRQIQDVFKQNDNRQWMLGGQKSGQSLGDAFTGELKNYGDLKNYQKLLSEAVGREGSHSALGLVGGMMAGTGVGSGSAVQAAKGMASGMAYQAAKKRANAVAANVMDKSGDWLSRNPEVLTPLIKVLGGTANVSRRAVPHLTDGATDSTATNWERFLQGDE